jgi:hypothetical protein
VKLQGGSTGAAGSTGDVGSTGPAGGGGGGSGFGAGAGAAVESTAATSPYISFTMKKNTVVTLSTLPPTQQHGNFTASPAPTPFPSSYATNFTEQPVYSAPAYFADQAGTFEIRNAHGMHGDFRNVMRQVCPERGVVYRGDTRPLTVIGSPKWTDVAMRFEFNIEEANATGVFAGVRVQNLAWPETPGQGGGLETTNMKGLFVGIGLTNWTVALDVVSLGIARAGGGKSKVVLSGVLPTALNEWHVLETTVKSNSLQVRSDHAVQSLPSAFFHLPSTAACPPFHVERAKTSSLTCPRCCAGAPRRQADLPKGAAAQYFRSGLQRRTDRGPSRAGAAGLRLRGLRGLLRGS